MKTKFLLLAAGVMLAIAFTLSCSGDDGADGTNGADGTGCVSDVDDNGSVWLNCGTAPAVMVSCGGGPFNAKTQICDARDGNAYKFVEIGEQVWLAENLKFKTAGSTCYDNLPSKCAKYGRLYPWAEAMVACPSGWSLPDTTKFAALIAFAGSNALAKLKSEEEVGGTDNFGFGALLGGGHYSLSGVLSYNKEGSDGNFLTSTEYTGSIVYAITFSGTISNSPVIKSDLFSVRCIKD